RPCRTTRRTCGASSTSTPARGTPPASCCATSWWSVDRPRGNPMGRMGPMGPIRPTPTYPFGETTMSTKLADVQNDALIGVSVYPASVNDTNTGSSVDMIDADGSCFAIQVVGAVTGTSPSLAGKIQESS